MSETIEATKPNGGARWFAVGGAVLLSAAGVFLWLDLALDPQYLLALGAALATAIGLARRPALATTGQLVLLTCIVVGGAAYGIQRTDALLFGVAVAAAGATVHALVVYLTDDRDGLRRSLASHSFVLAALLGSGALYFRFVTLGLGADHLVRRLVLTLAWLVAGIVFVVVRSPRARWHAGYLFVIVAVAKALAYDTVRLDGALRIATLGAAGALLLAGAWLLGRRSSAAEVA